MSFGCYPGLVVSSSSDEPKPLDQAGFFDLTQLDMVRVVCAAAGRGRAAGATAPRTAAATNAVPARRDIVDILPNLVCPHRDICG